ncbi:hypothetical protein ZEAMMB73_Zm00001d034772 [Zea mays]|uniref:Uncharacterized protein n=2 Tax=Zea mays TaxID=4577 RepID=A0A1D6LB16_MAIZE|nr:hypothetical protein ZEAMMB73_Zm00001d034772 [Zea mays]
MGPMTEAERRTHRFGGVSGSSSRPVLSATGRSTSSIIVLHRPSVDLRSRRTQQARGARVVQCFDMCATIQAQWLDDIPIHFRLLHCGVRLLQSSSNHATCLTVVFYHCTCCWTNLWTGGL